VVRVVFTFTPRLLIVTKVGLLRASRMEFEMEKCGFHVFRTHVSEERCVFLGVLGGFLRVLGGLECENGGFEAFFDGKSVFLR
jgi:hypothetical protein